VTDGQDQDQQASILDLVHDSVVPEPQPIVTAVSRDGLAAGWPRVTSKVTDDRRERLALKPGQAAEVPLRSWGELDRELTHA
jgi:hypothetical protein